MGAVTKQGVPGESSLQRVSSEHPSLPPLGQELHRQVANAFVLFGNYKHYHWQTYGPLFRDLHVLFDEFAKEALLSIDCLVERIQAIGEDLPGHLITAIDLATVPVATPHATMREMVEEAARNVLLVVTEMRDTARIAAEHDDQGTAQRVSQVVRVYEQHKWWFRDILSKREGPYLV